MAKNFWKKRRVLVTGGTGLLGSELVIKLLELDAHVVLIVRDRVSKSRVFLEGLDKKCDLVYGTIDDYFLVERAVGEYEIDTIFHLAAQTIVPIANASPLSTFNTNIKGTWNILEAARVHSNKVTSVVVASSDKAYGIAKKLPYNEDVRLEGRYPYDVSKSCTDLISQSYWHTFGVPVNVTRCGNLFGPGDLNFSRLIPGMIMSVLHNETPIIRSDGKYIRNYFYIKDAVDGYLTISENRKKTPGEAFNLASPDRFTVLEVTNMIIELMGSSLKPKVLNQAKNEIPEQYLSVKKAKKVLDWKSQYTLKDSLQETIDWYKANLEIMA